MPLLLAGNEQEMPVIEAFNDHLQDQVKTRQQD
jgi:hypothetical protein